MRKGELERGSQGVNNFPVSLNRSDQEEEEEEEVLVLVVVAVKAARQV